MSRYGVPATFPNYKKIKFITFINVIQLFKILFKLNKSLTVLVSSINNNGIGRGNGIDNDNDIRYVRHILFVTLKLNSRSERNMDMKIYSDI